MTISFYILMVRRMITRSDVLLFQIYFNIVKRRLPGQASIYTAELCAILLALDVVNNSNEDKYIICVDLLSCLQAIEQQHIDHPLVLDVLEKCSALINKTVLFCWVPSHVGIRGNELADAAAKAALNERLTMMTLPYSDFKPLVKRFIRGKWSDFWATQINNKLHSVQPTLGCGSLSNRDRRREQLVFCRLRLGHTYTTHRYLLAGEDPPVCISCQENLTVEHILIHCAEYFHVRYQCFDVNNLGELFRTVSPNIIIQFIKRTGLLYLI